MYTLEENYQDALDKIEELQERIDKAIEYIGLNEEDLKLYDIYDVNGIELLNILRGEDIKEIPQFEGTLEQLDKLSIRGDKE